MSTGAVVVTTNASPMSEHVTPDVGVLIDPVAKCQHGLATAWCVDAPGVARAVRTVAAMTPGQRADMGARARARFQVRNAEFQAMAIRLLSEL